MRLDAAIGAALAEDALTLACLHDVEVTAGVLRDLQGVGFPDNLALAAESAAMRQGRDLMRAAMATLPEAIDASGLDALAADFAAIYLTGAHGASPCESYWLSDDHLVCQDPMFELRTLYAASGLRAPDWRKRPDDHLAYQLQYLANRLQAAVTDADWRAMAGFLDEHLLRWLPDFARRVATRVDTPFYGALAVLTHGWCDGIRDLLAGELGEARPTTEEIEERLRDRRAEDEPVLPLRFIPGAAGPSW